MFRSLRKNTSTLFVYLLSASFCQPTLAVRPREALRGAVKTAAKPNRKPSAITKGKHWWVNVGGANGNGENGSGAANGSGSGSQLSGTNAVGFGGGGGGSSAGGGNSMGAAGAGGGSSLGSDPSRAKEVTQFDDNAPKNDSGRPLSGGNGPGGVNPQTQAFDKFYAMCLFMDGQAVSAQRGNETIKKMTDNMAQACGVNLVVFPVTVAPGSYNPDAGAAEANNKLQMDACNIVGKIPGVTNASTSFCVSSLAMADEMCKGYAENPPYDSDPRDIRYKEKLPIAGCAVVNSATGSEDYDAIVKDYERQRDDTSGATSAADKAIAIKRLKDIKADGSKGGSGRMSIAPSIEDGGSCDSQTVAHEAIGHSMMGMPNGKGHGNGIGPKDGGDGEGWTPAGCAIIRKNAMKNDGTWRWEANRETYYVPPKDPGNWWKLNSGNKLFNDPPPIPLAGQVSPPKIVGSGKTVVFDDSLAKQDSAGNANPAPKSSTPTSGGASQASASDSDDPRHRKRPGLLTNAQKITKAGAGVAGDPPDETFIDLPRTPPPQGQPKATQSIGFDDSAPKNPGGDASVGPVGKPKVDPPPPGSRSGGGASGGSGGSQSTTYDDEAPKGESPGAPTVDSQLRSAPIGLAGPRGNSTTYDDNAVKGDGSVGTTASGERRPASVSSIQAGAGAGLSGADFFNGVGSPSEFSPQEIDNRERIKRRRQIQKAEDDNAVSRRPRGSSGAARRPRAISGGE